MVIQKKKKPQIWYIIMIIKKSNTLLLCVIMVVNFLFKFLITAYIYCWNSINYYFYSQTEFRNIYRYIYIFGTWVLNLKIRVILCVVWFFEKPNPGSSSSKKNKNSKFWSNSSKTQNPRSSSNSLKLRISVSVWFFEKTKTLVYKNI